MKRYLVATLALLCVLTAGAQTETEGNPEFQESEGVKDFGGFILDMGTMLNAEFLVVRPPLFLSALSWDTGLFEDAESPFQLNPDAVRFNPNITSIGGVLTGNYQPGFHGGFYPHSMNGRVQLQGTSYRFNNGVRLNTYGEYDADGYKRYNPAALPWEKNNFNAAFELKSANGKFGIRMEVQRGRNNPY